MRARLFALALFVAAAMSAGASELWIHVRVTESGFKPTSVEINVPLRLVERLAPILDQQRHHDAEIRLGHDDMDVRELREKWNQLKDGGTVVEDHAVFELRDGPRGQELSIREHDGSHVTMPADVIDALLSGPHDRLDLDAALRALARHGEGELVSARDDDAIVRIWLDDNPDPRD